MGLANPTVISCCHEFVQELCNFQNEIITFPSARADVIKKVQGFYMKSKVPNVVAAIDIPVTYQSKHHSSITRIISTANISIAALFKG